MKEASPDNSKTSPMLQAMGDQGSKLLSPANIAGAIFKLMKPEVSSN